MMNKQIIAYIFLFAVVLSGCTSRVAAQESASESPTVNLLAIQGAPGELPSFELNVDGASVNIPIPAELEREILTPVFHYNAPIIDAATGQPVRANVYVVDQIEYSAPTAANLMEQGTTMVRLSVRRGEEIRGPEDAIAWLIVEAPGYKQSVSRIRYWVEITERRQDVVKLVRVEEF